MTKKEWKRRKRRKAIAIISAFIIVSVGLFFIISFIIKEAKKSVGGSSKDDSLTLSVNSVTRSGEKSPLVGIINVENSGFMGLTGLELRNRYERADIMNPLMKEPLEKGAHYAVGVDGVCIQMIPLTESVPGGDGSIIIAYSPDSEGNIPEAEEKSITELIDGLCSEYSISTENIIRK